MNREKLNYILVVIFFLFNVHSCWNVLFLSVFFMVESPWTVSSLQKIGEVHLLVFSYLKRSPHCAKHYKLEVPSQNKRMYGVVKVHKLGTIWISQIYLHFFNNKIKRKKHLLDISWNNGNNSIRMWWYCLAIRKKSKSSC